MTHNYYFFNVNINFYINLYENGLHKVQINLNEIGKCREGSDVCQRIEPDISYFILNGFLLNIKHFFETLAVSLFFIISCSICPITN